MLKHRLVRLGLLVRTGPSARQFVDMKEKHHILSLPREKCFIPEVSGKGAMREGPCVVQAISDWEFHDSRRSVLLHVGLISKVRLGQATEGAPKQCQAAPEQCFRPGLPLFRIQAICLAPKRGRISNKTSVAKHPWQVLYMQQGAAPKGARTSTERMEPANAMV